MTTFAEAQKLIRERAELLAKEAGEEFRQAYAASRHTVVTGYEPEAIASQVLDPEAPACPRDGWALVWLEVFGYRCPRCCMFVALPRRNFSVSQSNNSRSRAPEENR